MALEMETKGTFQYLLQKNILICPLVTWNCSAMKVKGQLSLEIFKMGKCELFKKTKDACSENQSLIVPAPPN